MREEVAPREAAEKTAGAVLALTVEMERVTTLLRFMHALEREDALLTSLDPLDSMIRYYLNTVLQTTEKAQHDSRLFVVQ